MTLRELYQELAGLPQRPSDAPIYVEDERGELHELQSLNVERWPGESGDGLLVVKFNPEVADV